ncbi:hypothetical protein RHMOL_Rhmol01G0049800 [Rhododendron molle]|uniref:Uncharacterized protein n=1 Tax=Rhododendron molle TaxID=49168 RepID=A0ACC0PY43_RHOML|nr:hypothetical protein RHMOL_Rhmol01G0049800 [Rhododendron molle]
MKRRSIEDFIHRSSSPEINSTQRVGIVLMPAPECEACSFHCCLQIRLHGFPSCCKCLGWSSMVLFGRVGGGIHEKAADIVGKVERNIPEDDPRSNQAVIADIVGEITGMGYDLVGFYEEPIRAALVFGSISSFGINHNCNALPFAH